MRSFCSGMMRAKTVAVRSALGQRGIVEPCQLRAGDDALGVEAGRARDRPRGRRIVAGDHHDADAGRAAFAHRAPARWRAADRRGRPARGTRRRNPAGPSGKSPAADARPRHAQDAHALAPPSRPTAACSQRAPLSGRGDRARRSPRARPWRTTTVSPSGARQTWVTASRSGRSPYCADQLAAGVAALRPPRPARRASWNARSIGSNGFGALASTPQATTSANGRRLARRGDARLAASAVRRSSCGSRSACRSCRCTAPWPRPASRWPRRGASARAACDMRQAPMTMKTRQHQGKLLRQHRHAERDAGQERVEPVAAQQAVEQRRPAG